MGLSRGGALGENSGGTIRAGRFARPVVSRKDGFDVRPAGESPDLRAYCGARGAGGAGGRGGATGVSAGVCGGGALAYGGVGRVELVSFRARGARGARAVPRGDARGV